MKKKIIQKMVKIRFDYLLAIQNLIFAISLSLSFILFWLEKDLLMILVLFTGLFIASFMDDVIMAKRRLIRKRKEKMNETT